ncbi:putative Ig domain-containing protein [Devosia sp. FKR38]|uniref:putative Ig domain-containing protein n=1 Tax=Devosia sp. FKR38 TaxID=2562312 RepID=UPI0010BFEE26|nr:putative Ig domain-containing protein [Devosia sp. FKR38]
MGFVNAFDGVRLLATVMHCAGIWLKRLARVVKTGLIGLLAITLASLGMATAGRTGGYNRVLRTVLGALFAIPLAVSLAVAPAYALSNDCTAINSTLGSQTWAPANGQRRLQNYEFFSLAEGETITVSASSTGNGPNGNSSTISLGYGANGDIIVEADNSPRNGGNFNVSGSHTFVAGEVPGYLSVYLDADNQGNQANTLTFNITCSVGGVITPGAPVIGTATAGDAEATVTFTAPASNGGAAITSYTVTASPGGATKSGSASPITVTGLTNGTAYTFTVTATNSVGSGSASQASNSVTPVAALPAPVANAVSATVAANSSNNAITLNLTGGAASGVAIGAAASHGTATASGTTIRYTPTTGYSGSDSFTYTATNTSGTSTPATVTVTVTAPTFGFAPAAGALTAARVGTAYNQAIAASGGTASYTYAITAGTLPAGLSLNTSTGAITGMPTTAGNASFTITATDANSATGSANYTLAVAATAPGAPSIGTATAGDAQASVTFTAPSSNGGAAITGYTVTASPGGATGTGSASPITVFGLTNGTAYTFSVVATNGVGPGSASQASNSVTPVAALLAPVANAVTATVAANSSNNAITLNLTGGAAASVAITTAAGHGTATASGTAITYTPTAGYSGTDSFAYTATNASGTSAPAMVSITVSAPTLAFSPSAGALTSATAGTAYNQSVAASGGAAPYGYAVTSGSLPAGLSLNTASGGISGTPTAAGNATFTVTATDANGVTGSANYSLAIAPQPVALSLSPSGGALTEAMAGEAYSQTISATGAVAPLIYSLTSGSLPNGMTLNISTGELTGPLAAASEGDYAFSIQVRANNGVIGTASFTLKVKPRAVTVDNKVVSVPSGSSPPNVNLAAGATGGPFVSGDLTFVEPPNAGTVKVVNGEFAQSGGATPTGWYLKFIPNPAYSGLVRVGFRLTSALGISNTGTVTYNVGFSAAAVAKDIDNLVSGFVQSRQSMIASTIKVPGLIQRRQMGMAIDPITARMAPAQDGVRMAVSTSLAQMQAADDAANGRAQDNLTPLNIWLDGTFWAHNRAQNAGKWGSLATVSAGIDYLLTEKALLGFSFHYDRMTDPSGPDTTLTGNGWLAGPYASFELGENVFWDTSLLYGGSGNTINTQFWRGTFATSRWLFDTAIMGRWSLDEVTFLTPKLRAVYLSETVRDYDISNGTGGVIGLPGFTSEQLRASVGLEIARQFLLESGLSLTPKLGATAGFAARHGSGAFGQVSAGLSAELGQALNIDLGVNFNVEGDGQRSVGARLGLIGRF